MARPSSKVVVKRVVVKNQEVMEVIAEMSRIYRDSDSREEADSRAREYLESSVSKELACEVRMVLDEARGRIPHGPS